MMAKLSPSDPAARERRAFLALGGLVLAAVAFFVVRPLLAPLTLAVLAAVIASPLYARVERWLSGRRTVAALATLALLTVAVGLPAVGLSTLFIHQSNEVLAEILGVEENRSRLAGLLQGGIGQLEQLADVLVGDTVDVERIVRDSMQRLAAGLYERSLGAVLQTGRLLLGVLIFYLVVFVLLARGRALLDLLLELSPTGRDDSRRILRRLQRTIQGVFMGSIVTALVQGVVGAVGFWIAGFQNQIVWGALLAGAGLVPLVGTGLVWLPATVYLLASGQTGDALGMLAVGAVVGTVDNLIKPLLIHERAEVHPVLVFLALFGGLSSMGAMGLVYGPLLVACLVEMVRIYRDELKAPCAPGPQ